MSKFKLLKRFRWNIGIFSLSLFLLVGCSASREVSVVSRGDEGVAVQETVAEMSSVPSPPPIIGSAFPQLEQVEEKLALPVPRTKQPVRIAPHLSLLLPRAQLWEKLLLNLPRIRYFHGPYKIYLLISTNSRFGAMPFPY